MNNCIFTGRLTKDPELKTTPSGKNYTRFTLAVDNGKDTNGDRVSIFVNFIAWNKTAEFITKYFKKGFKAGVISRYNAREYEDDSGNKKSYTEFIANEIEILENKPKQDATPATTPEPANPETDNGGSLPFEL